MYQNNVLCDLFIGKGAGKKMLTEIEQAKKSVKIISPYLSATLIYKLIQLKKRGLDVQLVTTDAIMENTAHYVGTFKQLISEKKTFDKSAQNLRSIISMFSKITWISLLIMIVLAVVFKDSEGNKLTLLVMGILISLVLGIILQLKLSKLRVFNFEYESVFPLKFLIAPENANFPIKTFVHSKVFIIDDEVMYWGSMNFTSMGTQDNYETRIRTTDEITISKMSQEFASLMNSNKLPERKLSIWGHQIYHGQNQDD